MAVNRRRPSITLTLDPDVVAATRGLLEKLPPGSSISSLVDELLRGFVVQFGPIIEELAAAEPGRRVAVMERLGGQAVLAFGKEFVETIEHFQALDAARALEELNAGKE